MTFEMRALSAEVCNYSSGNSRALVGKANMVNKCPKTSKRSVRCLSPSAFPFPFGNVILQIFTALSSVNLNMVVTIVLADN